MTCNVWMQCAARASGETSDIEHTVSEMRSEATRQCAKQTSPLKICRGIQNGQQ